MFIKTKNNWASAKFFGSYIKESVYFHIASFTQNPKTFLTRSIWYLHQLRKANLPGPLKMCAFKHGRSSICATNSKKACNQRHTHTHTHTRKHTQKHTSIHTLTYMHMYKHINDTNTQTHIETLTYIHSHAQAYTLTTQINTHWNIYAHKRGKQIKLQ